MLRDAELHPPRVGSGGGEVGRECVPHVRPGGIVSSCYRKAGTERPSRGIEQAAGRACDDDADDPENPRLFCVGFHLLCGEGSRAWLQVDTTCVMRRVRIVAVNLFVCERVLVVGEHGLLEY